jgi:hypothetical protein
VTKKPTRKYIFSDDNGFQLHIFVGTFKVATMLARPISESMISQWLSNRKHPASGTVRSCAVCISNASLFAYKAGDLPS